MANTKSAKKAVRGSAKKREHNSFWKRRISASQKNILKLVTADAGADILKESFSALQKVLDKAVKEDVIHKNTAARIKSKISKKINVKPKSAQPKSKSKQS